MIEIILDSTHDFMRAEEELAKAKAKAGNINYQPCMFSLSNAEDLKTTNQINAIHSIIQELYTSGCHSSDAKSLEQLKMYIKTDVIALLEIEEVYDKHNKVFKKRYRAKSMADYTKKEMTQAIENVLAYVKNCECNTIKMEKILSGMERDKIWSFNNKEEGNE